MGEDSTWQATSIGDSRGGYFRWDTPVTAHAAALYSGEEGAVGLRDFAQVSDTARSGTLSGGGCSFLWRYAGTADTIR